MKPRPIPILLALLGAVLVAALVMTRITVRTDIADFLPQGNTASSRFLLRELQSGAATTLILVAVEGAPVDELTRISRSLAPALDRTGLFTLVANGPPAADGPDPAFLWDHRYLLSPMPADAWTVPALHRAMERVLAQLRSSAGPVAARFGLADPPGAFLQLAAGLAGPSRLRTVGGVWFAPGSDRALLLLRTRAGGMDIPGQEAVGAALNAAFAAAHPGPARLLAAGPAVFAREAAQAIRRDVERLSAASGVLVLALLLWRFRSPLVIAAVGAVLALSTAAAALAVQAAYGFVHGIALGFGMTMLGVTVDYPVLFIGHRKIGESAAGTVRRIGPAFTMAVLTAALGLTGMALSSFPGLSQLGLFSLAGVLTAAAVTRWVLPPLVVAAGLAPVWAGDPAHLLRIESWRRWRAGAALPVLAAAAVLFWFGVPAETDVDALSPVPHAARELDRTLRTDLGAPDAGLAAVVAGPSAETVLQRQEALAPALAGFNGAEYAARILPSIEAQVGRQAVLPGAGALSARLTEASAGLPFRSGAFQPFADAVAEARAATPLTLADQLPPLLAARLGPLLFERDGSWYGPMVFPFATSKPDLLRAFAGAPDVTVIDLHAEANGVVGAYAAQAWRWAALGAAAALITLTVGLRDWRRVARIVGALASAGLVTVAILVLAGARFSLLHLVALQFAAGVGLDYALFFSRSQIDAEERARTVRTLVTCIGMTLLTFGLLAFCQTPLLRTIGQTVAIGAGTAMAFAFLLVGPLPEAEVA